MRSALTSLVLGLLPALAWAAEGTPAPAYDPGFGPLLRLLGGLGLIVGLMLLVYALYRRGFSLPGMKEGRIRIVETRALGGRKCLCLVQWRDRELLLGVAGDRITLLDRRDGAPESFAATLDKVETES